MGFFSTSKRSNSFLVTGTTSIIYAFAVINDLGTINTIASCDVTEEGLLLERGTCLRSILESVSDLDVKIRWAQEAADGLAYIHSKGIIHADIGCHNIIVDDAGHVKFIEFGGSGRGDLSIKSMESLVHRW
ncbi:hypothetical protein N7445_009853 [Penicillium cf. griseofulvum]|nr:hypothetical protein N7445_009853 [Penicillium cf. griseofulvum]